MGSGRRDDLYSLPRGLPVPIDDGACRHLAGMVMPSVPLRSTRNRWIDLSTITTGPTVVYCYPRTGLPDRDPPAGWNETPGARGCTPETCAFRDHFGKFQHLGVDVFGLSAQTTAYQQEMVARLHIPFEVLSDASFALAHALRLPTFEVGGMKLIKRLTLILSENRIVKVFYPVFPPDRHASELLDWLM